VEVRSSIPVLLIFKVIQFPTNLTNRWEINYGNLRNLLFSQQAQPQPNWRNWNPEEHAKNRPANGRLTKMVSGENIKPIERLWMKSEECWSHSVQLFFRKASPPISNCFQRSSCQIRVPMAAHQRNPTPLSDKITVSFGFCEKNLRNSSREILRIIYIEVNLDFPALNIHNDSMRAPAKSNPKWVCHFTKIAAIELTISIFFPVFQSNVLLHSRNQSIEPGYLKNQILPNFYKSCNRDLSGFDSWYSI